MRDTEVTHDSVAFTHGFNESFEYYAYTDERGWLWQIWRHLKGGGEITKIWFASISTKKTDQMLGNAVVRDGVVIEKGQLYDLNAYDPKVMLTGLVGLIKRGEWPEDIQCVTEKEEEAA